MGKRKLKLYGFNNLTKSLSFNLYDICFVENDRQRREYLDYIDSEYNSSRLTEIMFQLTEMIGARVLNLSKQDYDPQGASVVLLLADDNERYAAVPHLGSIGAHLDKSHITVHTYPEYHPDATIATFRVDIDIATCGQITPLRTLDSLITSFGSDIVTIDYKIRGFTRNVKGQKIYRDHPITSIQRYISPDILKNYTGVDINFIPQNIFHTRLMLNEIELNNYLFRRPADSLNEGEQKRIRSLLEREMLEIYNGCNL